MESIFLDYNTSPTRGLAQYTPSSIPVTGPTTGIARVAPTALQPNDNYAAQAYQMTLSDAYAASANMRTVQTQNYMIEQMNAGLDNSEV